LWCLKTGHGLGRKQSSGWEKTYEQSPTRKMGGKKTPQAETGAMKRKPTLERNPPEKGFPNVPREAMVTPFEYRGLESIKRGVGM